MGRSSYCAREPDARGDALTQTTDAGVWERHAAQWARVGPPLRPSPPDSRLLSEVIARWVTEHGAPRAMVLGVTPEMARLGWPEGTELLAVDKSAEMIANVWPGFPRPGEGALHADWLEMPIHAGSRDIVVGDGCFNVVRLAEVRALLARLRPLLSAHGLLAFRAFARPEADESPSDVYEAVLAGRIEGFHAFKLRLLMAVQPDSETGVVTGDVWRSWHRDGPGAAALHERMGWPLAQIGTIDAYRDQNTVYTFPTLAEIRAAATDAGFDETACTFGPYELGERCPTLVFRGG